MFAEALLQPVSRTEHSAPSHVPSVPASAPGMRRRFCIACPCQRALIYYLSKLVLVLMLTLVMVLLYFMSLQFPVSH